MFLVLLQHAVLPTVLRLQQLATTEVLLSSAKLLQITKPLKHSPNTITKHH
jgi:hypothetical protein